MNLNKGISTPVAIIIIVILVALVGGILWQYKGIIMPGCTTDSDCEYLECPSRSELHCTSVQLVDKRCISGECECKCAIPEFELPEPPSGDELTYQGKSYVKTEQKYNEYIPDKFQVELEQGGTIYVYNGNTYTLHAADPQHGAYTYIKWKLKQQAEQEIDTSDWKTYRSEEYGFEVKYPSKYKVSTITGTNIGPAITADSYALISFNSDGVSEEKAKKEYNKIKVDSRDAYRSPIMGNRDGGKEFEVIIYNYPVKGEKLRILFSTKAPNREEELEAFDQILSTFKFF